MATPHLAQKSLNFVADDDPSACGFAEFSSKWRIVFLIFMRDPHSKLRPTHTYRFVRLYLLCIGWLRVGVQDRRCAAPI